MSADLLQTKLYVPRLRPSLVPRPHLIETLNQGLIGKLILISAPAGFGKTTLIVEWATAHSRGYRIADSTTPKSEFRTTSASSAQAPKLVWLSLDEEDSDPIRFVRYFIAALGTIHADFGAEILRLLEQTPPPPLKTAVAPLLNEIGKIPEDIVFVLDDYHLIRSEAIHETMAYFLERQPPQFHLVITTREDPPIPLPRWRVRGQLTEIRERDLRFTLAETASLLNEVTGLNLTEEQIEKLRSKTEGWVSGLQLAALSLRDQPHVDQFVNDFAGSNRFVLDYLIEEVFRQQPPDVRMFLLATAVLEQLTAPLCDAVLLNEGDSQAMLERLEQSNLFIIALDESRQWFRYHHLFADLLRHRLRLEREETAVFHMRAARWLEQNGFPRRAVNHYLKAADWEKAAALIQLLNPALQRQGENITFLRWMTMLPDSTIQANPALCLDYAWVLALNGQPDKADSFLQIAAAAFRETPKQYNAVLSAQIHVARIRHDLPQTVHLSRQALSLMPEAAYNSRSALLLNLGIAHWQQGQITEAEQALTEAQEAAKRAENHHVRLLAVGFLGLAQAAQGHLHKAESLLQATLAWGADYPASGLPHLVLGALFYEWNRLEKAQSHLQNAIDLAQQSGTSELTCSAYRQWALLKLAQGDSAAALAALTQAETAAGKNTPPQTAARNNAVAVIIALAQNNLDLARNRIEKMPTAVAASPFYAPLFLAPARLSIAQGNLTAAAAHLAGEYGKAERLGLRYGQIEIRLLQALAATDESLLFLADALAMGQSAKFMRIFLDKGKALIPLLHMAVNKQVFPEYASTLLALFEVSMPPTPLPTVSVGADSPLVEAISEREIEVLQLLADGRSNKEIAQTLFVSINTVKSHLKSIYGKLGVHNRREAVAQARVLHLLPPL